MRKPHIKVFQRYFAGDGFYELGDMRTEPTCTSFSLVSFKAVLGSMVGLQNRILQGEYLSEAQTFLGSLTNEKVPCSTTGNIVGLPKLVD